MIFRLLRQHWGWFIVTIFSLLASWHYFFGTPHVLGLDYFIHLAQANIIKEGIGNGIPIPAYHYLHGAGTTFIRYQGMLIAQLMGWCCFTLQLFINVSDTKVIMLVGRFFGILLNLGAGLSFYWSAKKIIDVYGEKKIICTNSSAIVASSAYIFGWSRWGVVLHVGSLQRAGALIFFPIAFAILLTLLRRPLKKNEQITMAIATSCCLMCHPGSFIYLIILCILYFAISAIISPSKTFQWQKLRTIILPTIISLCIAAWFLFPLVLEKEYYGIMRQQQQLEQNVSWGEVLPMKYALEFINRENWFSNLETNPDKGGSFLGGFGGVNSAYFGITVLLLAMFGAVAFPRSSPLNKVSISVSILTVMVTVLVFWKGLRHNVFHTIGHHFTLPFYWLEPLYFCVCICVLFGAVSISDKLLKFVKLNTARGIMVMLALILSLDFFSLVTMSKAGEMYSPQQGKQDPIGISGNNYTLDSYKILKNAPKGRVLDLPKLLLNCNRLYHKQSDILSEEPNTDWTEAKYYTEQIAYKEMLQAIPFSLEYGNYRSLPLKKINSNVPQSPNSKYLWETKENWQGIAKLNMELNLPQGKFDCWIVLPILLTSQTKIEAFYQGKSVAKVEAKEKGFHYYLIVPMKLKNTTRTLEKIAIKIEKNYLPGKVVIGIEEPFVAYSGNSISHRLAILDIRYIVLNLRYFKSPTSRVTESSTIQKIYQSRTSVLYKNTLSTPAILPKKVMRIEASKAWELFDKISHHPNFNPHKVSFCYEGDEIKDTVTEENWEEKLIPLFLDKQPSNKIECQVIHNNLESITYRIHSQKDGFFFPSLHYHPNLKVYINGNSAKKYLAQAGMIATKIPKGNLDITIEYEHPWYDKLGKWISLITLLLLVVYFLQQLIRNLVVLWK